MSNWQKQLLDINGKEACDPAREWAAGYASFADAYDACTDKDWINWLVNALGLASLTEGQRKAYDEASATARKAYASAIAPARKAYDEARATALKAHDEADAKAWKAYYEADAKARKAHDEADAKAWKAYDEADAKAWKAYTSAIKPLVMTAWEKL